LKTPSRRPSSSGYLLAREVFGIGRRHLHRELFRERLELRILRYEIGLGGKEHHRADGLVMEVHADGARAYLAVGLLVGCSELRFRRMTSALSMSPPASSSAFGTA
jgi:hypothetical protein